jgi:hypothetical protein
MTDGHQKTPISDTLVRYAMEVGRVSLDSDDQVLCISKSDSVDN